MTPLLRLAQNENIAPVLLLLALIFLLKEITLVLLRQRRGLFYALILPGIALHEFFHLIGCVITFTPIHSVKLVGLDGGRVTHEKPRIPIVAPFIISFLPLAGGLTTIFFLNNLAPTISNSLGLAAYVLADYLIITILLSMFPSRQDFINAWPAYLIIVALIYASYSRLTPFFANPNLISLFSLCLIVLVVVNLILGILLYFRWK